MSLEIELKFALHPNELLTLSQHPLLANHALECVQINSYYYDTDQYDIRKSGFIIRLCECDGHYTQTVKTIDTSQYGLHQRMEWTHALNHPTLDTLLLQQIDVLKTVLSHEVKAHLQRQFKTQITRTNWLISATSAQVMVSLDNGYIIVGDEKKPICEVELELLHGDENYLRQVAAQLRNSVNLAPRNHTKSDVGYALLSRQLETTV